MAITGYCMTCGRERGKEAGKVEIKNWKVTTFKKKGGNIGYMVRGECARDSSHIVCKIVGKDTAEELKKSS